jgi:pre-60S factor REI1
MLTSTTAPGKTFSTRAEIAEHYKSDWHKYNLKRREAGLPLLEETDFQARWEAALALRKEKEDNARTGTDHLKQKRASSKKHQQKQQQPPGTTSTTKDTEDKDTPMLPATKILPQVLVESQENPTIDPKQSLFDNQMSDTLEENVDYMRLNFGFFIPDRGTCAQRESSDRMEWVFFMCL